MFAGASVKIHVPHRRGLRLLVPGGATDATGTADSGYRVQSLRRWGRTAYTYMGMDQYLLIPFLGG